MNDNKAIENSKSDVQRNNSNTGDSTITRNEELDELIGDNELVDVLQRVGVHDIGTLHRMAKWDEEIRRYTLANDLHLNPFQVGALLQILRGECD